MNENIISIDSLGLQKQLYKCKKGHISAAYPESWTFAFDWEDEQGTAHSECLHLCPVCLAEKLRALDIELEPVVEI